MLLFNSDNYLLFDYDTEGMRIVLRHPLTVCISSYSVLKVFCLCCQPYFVTELKEQLLARSSRVDDIERLKTEFNDQKREIKEQNEAELESLRR